MSQPNQPTAQQQNDTNRAILLANAVPVQQVIFTTTQAAQPYVAGLPTVINVPVRPVGLITKFLVEVTATVAQGAAETQTRTTLGLANFFSNIMLNDLQNLTRHQTTGWHMNMVNTARRQMPTGAAYTTDNVMGFGSNYGFNGAPSTFTTAQTLKAMLEIPVSYSDTDLRGAIFANVINSTMNLQLTINPNFSVASGADATQACYQSSTTDLAKITAYTITVHQFYYDQLPKDQNGGYILPLVDLATQYNLINTSYSALVAGSEFPMPYANYRSFLSTVAIYDNGGTLNAGTDIQYWAMRTANSLNLFQYDPFVAQMLNGRNKIGDDWPKGVYYFDHRARPVTTLQFGNIDLIANPSVVNAGAQMLVGYEFMAMTQQLQSAGTIGNR